MQQHKLVLISCSLCTGVESRVGQVYCALQKHLVIVLLRQRSIPSSPSFSLLAYHINILVILFSVLGFSMASCS